jgi:hypothetical protein
VRNFLHPGGLGATIRAACKGFFPGSKVRGDALQLGGVFVVRPDGTIPFHHPSRYVGDHPSSQAILKALG